MQPFVLLVLAALSALAFYFYRRHEASPVRRRELPVARAVAAASVAVAPVVRLVPKRAPPVSGSAKLEELAWDGPVTSVDPIPPLPTRAQGADLVLQRKIRDRYIAARFPCTARSSIDLENVEHMIKAARLFFEEDQPDRAMELLTLAIEQCPRSEALRLAQIEIAFLMRDAEAFAVLGLEFRRTHPESKDWDVIARLGRTVAPQEPAFGRLKDATDDAHYGPWPDTPNWIQASWDLTGEVLATDFHRVMNQPQTPA